MLLEDGLDLRVPQRLLGHENIATTALDAHVGDSGLMRELEQAGCWPTWRAAEGARG